MSGVPPALRVPRTNQQQLIGKLSESSQQVYCSRDTDLSQVSVQYFMTVGLGLGATRHGERPVEGEVGRKGISCERTFSALSAPADLEAKVCLWLSGCCRACFGHTCTNYSAPLCPHHQEIREICTYAPLAPALCIVSVRRLKCPLSDCGEQAAAARQHCLTCTISGHSAPAAVPGNGCSSSFSRGRCLQLREISEKLAEHMAREGLQGRTVTLKLKSALTFEVCIQRLPAIASHSCETCLHRQ